jgi:ribosomal protein S18 acetylase RimI-like enzyme
MNSVIPLSMSLVAPASVTCAQAFEDDPFTRYTVPDAARRANLHYVFEYYMRVALLGKTSLYTTSPACEGVAMWRDSRAKDPFGLALRVNPLLLTRCGWGHIMRQFPINHLCENIKKQLAPKHHVYLSLLAVRPPSQGRGLAHLLMDALLAELERDRLPCYLETQNLRNTGLYQNFGFRVIREVMIPGARLPFYMMLREPRKA